MVGLNVTEKTLFTRALLDRVGQTHGRRSDFAAGVLNFMLGVAERLGRSGSPMHDPLAMGAVIDPTLITTEDMHVDIETRGELTRGETVASRHNSSDHRSSEGDRLVVETSRRSSRMSRLPSAWMLTGSCSSLFPAWLTASKLFLLCVRLGAPLQLGQLLFHLVDVCRLWR